jgi:hypothetical protein
MTNTKTTEIEVAAHKRRVQTSTKPISNETPGWVQTGDKIAIRVVTIGSLLVVATVYWQIAIGVTVAGAAGWALKQSLSKSAPIAVQAPVEPEKAPEAPKPKRSYKHRIKINHYQLGKVSA